MELVAGGMEIMAWPVDNGLQPTIASVTLAVEANGRHPLSIERVSKL